MTDFLLTKAILLLVAFTALPIHEAAHGWTAYRLGDTTAKDEGRLTLNPLRHLDLMGTVLLVVCADYDAAQKALDALGS